MARKPKKDKSEMTKGERVEAEKKRLSKEYKNVDQKKRNIAQGLIESAAFLRVEIEDLQADIAVHGFTEKFSQGNQKPYDRNRPVATAYASMLDKYTKIIGQLDRMLPKEQADSGAEINLLTEFAKSRRDV